MKRTLLFSKNITTMKYRKLISDIVHQKSNSNTEIAIGLIAGLAVGAVLGVLFAPESGEQLRKGILGKANDYADGLQDDFTGSDEAQEAPYVSHPAPKHPKSNIKDLIHQAHTGEQSN